MREFTKRQIIKNQSTNIQEQQSKYLYDFFSLRHDFQLEDLENGLKRQW